MDSVESRNLLLGRIKNILFKYKSRHYSPIYDPISKRNLILCILKKIHVCIVVYTLFSAFFFFFFVLFKTSTLKFLRRISYANHVTHATVSSISSNLVKRRSRESSKRDTGKRGTRNKLWESGSLLKKRRISHYLNDEERNKRKTKRRKRKEKVCGTWRKRKVRETSRKRKWTLIIHN